MGRVAIRAMAGDIIVGRAYISIETANKLFDIFDAEADEAIADRDIAAAERALACAEETMRAIRAAMDWRRAAA